MASIKQKRNSNISKGWQLFFAFAYYITLLFYVLYPGFVLSPKEEIWTDMKMVSWIVAVAIALIAVLTTWVVSTQNNRKIDSMLVKSVSYWFIESAITSIVGFSLLSLSFSTSINPIIKVMIPSILVLSFVIFANRRVYNNEKKLATYNVMRNKFHSSKRIISYSTLMFFVIFLVVATSGIKIVGPEDGDIDIGNITIAIQENWIYMIILAIYFLGIMMISFKYYFDLFFKKFDRSVVVEWIDDSLSNIAPAMIFYFTLIIAIDAIVHNFLDTKNTLIITNSIGIAIFGLSLILNIFWRFSLIRNVSRNNEALQFFYDEYDSPNLAKIDKGLLRKANKAIKAGNFNTKELRIERTQEYRSLRTAETELKKRK